MNMIKQYYVLLFLNQYIQISVCIFCITTRSSIVYGIEIKISS